MLEKIFLAFVRFYEHNNPLIFLVPIILASFFFLIIKPKRRIVFLLLGALLLLLEFEYTNVIFRGIKSDWLNQIFADDFRFRKYQISTFFFQDLVPFGLSIFGWLFLALAGLV